MDAASVIAPEWYIEARRSGASKDSLVGNVEEFCLKALKRQAEKRGLPEPTQVEPELVSITIDMYENALAVTGAEP